MDASTFLLYCREGGSGRFYPLARNGLAKNLIHALRWPTREKAESACKAMSEDNKGWTFEVRERKAKAREVQHGR